MVSSSDLLLLGFKAQAGEPIQVESGAFLRGQREGPFQSSWAEDALRTRQKVCDQELGQLGCGAGVSVGSLGTSDKLLFLTRLHVLSCELARWSQET